MLRWIIVFLLMFQVAQAGSKYFIKFGSFKNLQGLEGSIAQLPKDLRSHVVIIHKNGWYVPFAYLTKNKQALQSRVSLYKPYFRDAHISSSSNILDYPLVRNYGRVAKPSVAPKRNYVPSTPSYPVAKRQDRLPPLPSTQAGYQNIAISEEDHILPIAQSVQAQPQLQVSQPKVEVSAPKYQTAPLVTHKVVMKKPEEDDVFSTKEPKKFKHFSKEMLSGNAYYLAYKKTKTNPDLLIKVTFGNHSVNYQPVIGDMKMTNASYLIENNRLYMFTEVFTRNGSFSKLEEHRANHFLVSSWVNGKKLNTLRYYYKLNDAKRYLGFSTSDGLAEVLSEGGYDELFVDE